MTRKLNESQKNAIRKRAEYLERILPKKFRKGLKNEKK